MQPTMSSSDEVRERVSLHLSQQQSVVYSGVNTEMLVGLPVWYAYATRVRALSLLPPRVSPLQMPMCKLV